MYFQIYRQGGTLLAGQWRWRLHAANHKIIADSGESYHNRQDCIHAINLVVSANSGTPII